MASFNYLLFRYRFEELSPLTCNEGDVYVVGFVRDEGANRHAVVTVCYAHGLEWNCVVTCSHRLTSFTKTMHWLILTGVEGKPTHS